MNNHITGFYRGVGLILSFLLLYSCTNNEKMESDMEHVKTMDLSKYSSSSPKKPLDVLFIHHSTGGQLLADAGPDVGKDCIYRSHPNGGGLRNLLESNNYKLHEASYNSIVGDKTDICHWNAKFRVLMDKILICKNQDEFYQDNTRNKVVMFKSCFPNSNIISDGTPPGDPDSCIQTTANYQAAYKALLDYFARQPDTLFVVVTAPPLVKPSRIKDIVKGLLGRESTIDKVGLRARMFNNWLKDTEKGWLKDYRLKNVVVFDYYNVLTGYGKSNWLLYPTQGGTDSHPSSEGNSLAAREFISFLNKSVNRMESE
jgi:hypothetical protein